MNLGTTGEILGNGYPDWPSDLLTYEERKAYQRGVADARRVDRQPPMCWPADFLNKHDRQEAELIERMHQS